VIIVIELWHGIGTMSSSEDCRTKMLNASGDAYGFIPVHLATAGAREWHMAPPPVVTTFVMELRNKVVTPHVA
jgi:hypothetical protein